MCKNKKSVFLMLAVITAMAFLCGSLTLSLNRVHANNTENSAYVELYSPIDDVKIYTSNASNLTATIKDNDKTESGKGLSMSYTPCSETVSVTIPVVVKKDANNFEGLAFWIDVPETADEYSFTIDIVKSENIVQYLVAGKTITLISENGTVTEKTTVKGEYRLNGFTGWVLLPKDAYYDAKPIFANQYDLIISIKTAKTQAMELTLGSFGYYTDYYALMAKHANVNSIANQVEKAIDGYIEQINSLLVTTNRQIKLRNKMLVDYVNLKENFNSMSNADKIAVAKELEKEYQARVEDCLYGDIKQTGFVMSFATMSDTHVSNTFYNPEFASALEDAKALNPNLAGAIVLGDLSDNGISVSTPALSQLDDYYNFINSYEYKNSKGEDIPIMNILGNHDIRGAYLDPEGHYPTSSYEPAVKMYLEREGVESLQHDKWINGYHFIFLNADRYERDNGYLSAQTITWLDETLSENEDGRPIFVMIHQPVNEVITATDATMTFAEVIAKHPTAIVSSGHKHSNFNGCKIIQKGEGVFINQPSMMDLNAIQYYYVEVYNGGVVYRARDAKNDVWQYSNYVVVPNEIRANNLLLDASNFDLSTLTANSVTASIEKYDSVSGKAIKLVATDQGSVSLPINAKSDISNHLGYAFYVNSDSEIKLAINGSSLIANATYYGLTANGLVERTVSLSGEVIADGWVIIPKTSINGTVNLSSATQLNLTVNANQTIYFDQASYYFNLENFVSAVSTLNYAYKNGSQTVLKGELKFGDKLVPPTNITRNSNEEFDFTFIGWDIDGDGFVDSLPQTIKGDITATAIFSSTVRKYTYTFYSANSQVLSTATANYGSEIIAPTVSGLYGWDIDNDGLAETLPEILTCDLEIKAVLTDSAKVLEYSFNDGKGFIYKAGQVNSGETIIVPENPVSNIDGVYFVGWDTDNDGYPNEIPTSITQSLNAVAIFYDFNMLEMVNDGTTNGWSQEGGNITFENATYALSPTGKATLMKLNEAGVTSGTKYAKVALTYDRQPTALAVWFDSSSMGAFTMRVWKSWEAKQDIKYGGDYLYFYADNGTVTKCSGWREMSVPANFRGYMIVPMTAFTTNGTMATLVEGDYLRLGFPISENGNTNLKGNIYFGEVLKLYCSIDEFLAKSDKQVYQIRDYDGSLINCGMLGENQTSVELTVPVREGWTFVGWDINADGVADQVPTVWGKMFIANALYTREFTYKFVDKDGNIILEKTATVNSLILPPFRYMHGEDCMVDYGGYEEGMLLDKDYTFVVTVVREEDENQNPPIITPDKPIKKGCKGMVNDSVILSISMVIASVLYFFTKKRKESK